MAKRPRPHTALVATAILASAAAFSEPAWATCSNGFTLYLSGQIPDVTFTSGEPATVRFNPWYVSLPSLSYSCGIVARSTTPGVSIQQSYGCPGGTCPILPPGQWAAVGDAYAPLFTEVNHKTTDIPLVFDGTAPPGTYGTVEIAIRDNDAGVDSQFVIGKVNVYIEAGTPPATWFGVGTSAANVVADSVVLDHPYLNGNPNARIFVSHGRNPGGSTSGTSWNHAIGVVFDAPAQRWTIRNLDGTAMPVGLGFGVRIDPTAERHCAPSIPGTYTSLTIANQLASNNPFATILVTPIGGPAAPLAVRYVTPNWQILYSNGAAIPVDTCFNVKVLAFTQYLEDPASGDLSGRANVTANWGTGVDVGGHGAGHNSGAFRYLQFDWALDNPFRQVMVTNNQTPLGFHAVVDPRHFGVHAPRPDIAGTRWAVYHEDGAAMPLGARFNVWAPCAGARWYPDADGDSYGVAGAAQASCAPLAGHASRGGDCDDGNAFRRPGAPELNDGQDNHCPGDAGFGLVDEIAGELWFEDRTTVCWEFQAAATSYRLTRSPSAGFAQCTLYPTTSSVCIGEGSVPAPGQASFFLVRSNTPWQGSWGADSSGDERFPGCD